MSIFRHGQHQVLGCFVREGEKLERRALPQLDDKGDKAKSNGDGVAFRTAITLRALPLELETTTTAISADVNTGEYAAETKPTAAAAADSGSLYSSASTTAPVEQGLDEKSPSIDPARPSAPVKHSVCADTRPARETDAVQHPDKGGVGSAVGLAVPGSPAPPFAVTARAGDAFSSSLPAAGVSCIGKYGQHQLVARGSVDKGMEEQEEEEGEEEARNGEKAEEEAEEEVEEQAEEETEEKQSEKKQEEDIDENDEKEDDGKEEKKEEKKRARTSLSSTIEDAHPEHVKKPSGLGHVLDESTAAAVVAETHAPASAQAVTSESPPHEQGAIAYSSVASNTPGGSEPTPSQSALQPTNDVSNKLMAIFLGVALWLTSCLAGVYIFRFRGEMLEWLHEKWSTMATLLRRTPVGIIAWLRRRRSITAAWLCQAFMAMVTWLHQTRSTTIGRLRAAAWVVRICFVAFCYTVPPVEVPFYVALWLTNHMVGFFAWQYRRQSLAWIQDKRLVISAIIHHRRVDAAAEEAAIIAHD